MVAKAGTTQTEWLCHRDTLQDEYDAESDLWHTTQLQAVYLMATSHVPQ